MVCCGLWWVFLSWKSKAYDTEDYLVYPSFVHLSASDFVCSNLLSMMQGSIHNATPEHHLPELRWINFIFHTFISAILNKLLYLIPSNNYWVCCGISIRPVHIYLLPDGFTAFIYIRITCLQKWLIIYLMEQYFIFKKNLDFTNYQNHGNITGVDITGIRYNTKDCNKFWNFNWP